MKSRFCALALSGFALLSPLAGVADAQPVDFGKIAKDAVGDAVGEVKGVARRKVMRSVNAKLMAEGRKNQCSFKTDTDELAAGCDTKLKRLTNVLIEVKKRLKVAGVTDYKFEVSGHTDSTGSDEHNKALAGRRAAVIVKELVRRGIPEGEIDSVAMGASRPRVKKDNTPAKRAKNRRYEIQVRS